MATTDTLTEEQATILADARIHARALARTVIAASEAGISNAILLPELVAILREAGFSVPRGLERFL